MQYKLEVYCGLSLSPKFRSQQGTALQMGGELRYKLEEVYCQCFSDELYGLGVPEQFPCIVCYKKKRRENRALSSWSLGRSDEGICTAISAQAIDGQVDDLTSILSVCADQPPRQAPQNGTGGAYGS